MDEQGRVSSGIEIGFDADDNSPAAIWPRLRRTERAAVLNELILSACKNTGTN